MLKIKNFLTGKKEPVADFSIFFGELSTEYNVRKLAFAKAVGKIARSLAKCEIKTFVEGEEVLQAYMPLAKKALATGAQTAR